MEKRIAVIYFRECLYVLLGLVLGIFLSPLSCSAIENANEKSQIIVSLGDSYSSGEGIEPFYGQEKSIPEKVKDHDWLAHRSKESWPGMLKLPAVGIMSEHRDTNWFFVATSGAETKHMTEIFHKPYQQFFPNIHKVGKSSMSYSSSGYPKDKEWGKDLNNPHPNKWHPEDIPPQLNVFDNIEKLFHQKADYVTLTLGGNDVGFDEIVRKCATGITYTSFNELQNLLDTKWEEFEKHDGVRDSLKTAYEKIAEKAGSQADIIVAGYPELFYNKDVFQRYQPEVGQILIDSSEANLVNKNVSKFNKEIEKIVKECQSENKNIYFVSVEKAFEGHGAYSKNPWINGIMIPSRSQDLYPNIASAFSVHPNEKGAKAYAECVQAKIDELETKKYTSAMGLSAYERITNSPLVEDNIGDCVTNGERIYYATGTAQYLDSFSPGVFSNVKICQYTIDNKESKIIYSLEGEQQAISMIACDGTYLYFGGALQYEGVCGGLTVYNIKTNDIVTVDATVGEIQVSGSKLLLSATDYYNSGAELYLIDRDGRNKQLLSGYSVPYAEVKGDYIYYKEIQGNPPYTQIRECRCNLDGSGMMVIEDWK